MLKDSVFPPKSVFFSCNGCLFGDQILDVCEAFRDNSDHSKQYVNKADEADSVL